MRAATSRRWRPCLERVAAATILLLLAAPAMAQRAGGIPEADYVPYEHCQDGQRTTEARIPSCKKAMDAATGNRDDARFVLIGLYVRQRQFAPALDQIEQMLAFYSDSKYDRATFTGDNPRGDALEWRAWIYAMMGRLDDALRDADAASPLLSDETTALIDRCRLRAIANSGLDKALDDCNAAIARHERRSTYYFVRALVYLRLNRLQDALADCDSAVDVNARDADARYLRGIVERRLGEPAMGDADIEWAKAHDIGIGEEPAVYGVTP